MRETVERPQHRAFRPAPRARAVRRPSPAVDWLQDLLRPRSTPAPNRSSSTSSTGRTVLGAVPTQRTVIAERFFDEGGGMQLVIHAPFGARINKAWGLALRKRFCRSFNFELQAAATDDGINIALAEQHSFPLTDVFAFLRPPTVREVLEQAALASPIFGTRWRWDAGRALALLRFRGGKKLPIQHPAPAVGRSAGRRSFPTSRPVRKTSKATSRFRIIRSSAR